MQNTNESRNQSKKAAKRQQARKVYQPKESQFDSFQLETENIQLWSNSGTMRGVIPALDAKRAVESKSCFVISPQAIQETDWVQPQVAPIPEHLSEERQRILETTSKPVVVPQPTKGMPEHEYAACCYKWNAQTVRRIMDEAVGLEQFYERVAGAHSASHEARAAIARAEQEAAS